MRKYVLFILMAGALFSCMAFADAPTDLPADADTTYSDQLHAAKAKIDEKNQACVNGDELACGEYKEASNQFVRVCTLAMQLWCSESGVSIPPVRPPTVSPIVLINGK